MRLALERRARQVRSRAQVRAWEYRQRNHARGAWFRLRRVLADAAEAYVVRGEDVQHLLEDGHTALAIGLEFSPPKTIVFAARERVAHGPGVRQVPVRLGTELLAAEHLVLVPFDGLPTNPCIPDADATRCVSHSSARAPGEPWQSGAARHQRR